MTAGLTLRGQATSGARWGTLGAATVTVSQLAQLVVLARLLRPTDFGLMGMLFIVVAFAQAFTDLGLSAAIIHRQDATREQLSSLYCLNVLAGCVVALLVLLSAPLVASLFREPRLVPLVRCASVLFVIVPLGKQFEVLLQRDLAFRRLAVQDAVASLAGFIAAVLCALAGLGVWALLLGAITTAAVRSFMAASFGWRHLRPTLRLRRGEITGFLSFGLFQVGEQTVNFVAERFDQVIIGSLLGAPALGLYNFAFNLTTQPASRINPIVTKVAFPALARLQHEPVRLRRGFMEMLQLLTTVNAPLLLGLAAVAPGFVPLVFGDAWIDSIPVLQILCLVAVSRSIGNPVGSLQLAVGRADLGFKWNVGLLIANVTAVLGGAHLGGLQGIALGLLCVQLLAQLLTCPLLLRPLVGNCGSEYVAAILPSFAVAVLMAAAAATIPILVQGLPPAAVVSVQIAAGATIYALGLLAFARPTVRRLRSFALSRG